MAILEPLEATYREQQPAGSPFTRFLREVRPRVEEILDRSGLPAEQAEDLLSETLRVLVWKWETVRNREAWLLAVLERKCCALAAPDGDHE